MAYLPLRRVHDIFWGSQALTEKEVDNQNSYLSFGFADVQGFADGSLRLLSNQLATTTGDTTIDSP